MFAVGQARADSGAATGGAQGANGANSDIALCAGIGLWDRGNKAENHDRFKNWKNDLSERSREHSKASPDPIKDAMDEELKKANAHNGALEKAVEYQNNFWKIVADSADIICPEIASYNHDVAKVKEKLDAAKAKQTSETCSFSDLKEINQGASAKLEKINAGLEAITEKMRSVYKDYAEHNKQAVMQTAQVTNRVPTAMHSGAYDRAQKLGMEYKQLWGDDQESKSAAEGKIREKQAKSLFGRMLTSLEEQSHRISTSKTNLAGYNLSISGLNESACKSFAPGAQTAGKLVGTPNDANNTMYDTDGKTLICKPGTIAVTENGALNPNRCDKVAASTTGGTQRDGNSNGNGSEGGVGGDLNGGERRPATPPPPAPAAEEESWLSKNKGTLIVGGVGVAAVAGALLWKKSEDDKAKKDARYMEMEAAMAVQAQQQSSSSSSDGGSSDSTAGGSVGANQTPVGSTLMIEGTPSGSVGTGTTLPPLTIKVVDPQGIMTTDSATDITVSCASSTPSPCTLTGTLTVNTDQGKATFSNLKFTGAHTNVTLLFSAGGFTPVKSGNFDVSGRQ